MSKIPTFTRDQFQGKTLADLLAEIRSPEIIELWQFKTEDNSFGSVTVEETDLTARTEEQARLIAEVVMESIPEPERPTDPVVFDAVRASARIALGLLSEGPLLEKEPPQVDLPHICR